MKFSDFERAQALALREKEEADLECVICNKCGCQWFEEVIFARFSANHNLVPGQNIPMKIGSLGYRFLRCVQCQNVQQPNVQHYVRDLAAGDYDFLLDTLEGKFKEEEKKEDKNAVQSEEL